MFTVIQIQIIPLRKPRDMIEHVVPVHVERFGAVRQVPVVLQISPQNRKRRNRPALLLRRDLPDHRFAGSYLNGLGVFPAFFNLSLNLAIRNS